MATEPVIPTTPVVTKVDIDMNALFDLVPTGDDIIIPEEKPSVLSSTKTDLDFLDEPLVPKTPAEIAAADKAKLTADELNNLLELEEAEVVETAKPGRPKVDKSALVATISKMITSEKLIAFDDDKKIEDYTEADFEELLEANFAEKERAIREETPKEFFQSLPEELQYAAKYVADGGKDIKGLFKALSHVEEVRALDATVEADQEQIVRSFLQANNFGDATEINEEIATYKELGTLGKKATTFKPKLDKMGEDVVKAQLAEAETNKGLQKKAAEDYINNVFTALRPGELSGMKLDKQTQTLLYNGLTVPSYKSIKGNQTNLLGHLLEKHQFVEPNYSLVAEALWLLSNPDEYRASLKKQGKEIATEETVRKLKTAQAQKIATGPDADEVKSTGKRITRPQNIFAR